MDLSKQSWSEDNGLHLTCPFPDQVVYPGPWHFCVPGFVPFYHLTFPSASICQELKVLSWPLLTWTMGCFPRLSLMVLLVLFRSLFFFLFSSLLRYNWQIILYIFKVYREFPGGLVVRIQRFHCRGPGSIRGWRTEIPQAVRCGQKMKKKIKKYKEVYNVMILYIHTYSMKWLLQSSWLTHP